MTYYYDPLTGNVSFDTANTVSGETISYNLRLFPDQTPIRIIPENHIRLTESPLGGAYPDNVQESTLGTAMRGLLTLGNILPAGLSQETWEALFQDPIGLTSNAPGFGVPQAASEFIYGHPGREFDNRWDLVDPTTLDWATEATLIYHQHSGEVFLDTSGENGGYISGFLLYSTGAFIFDNFTYPWESLVQNVDENRIHLLGNANEPGLYSLGRILEAGLSLNQVESELFLARFLANQEGYEASVDIETEGRNFNVAFVSVPEPSSFALVAIFASLLIARRQM